MGAPSTFKPEYVEQIRKLCELGATDRDICEFLEVAKTTLYRWRSQNPALAEAMKVGKEVADQRVETALYHRAVGYTFEAEKIFCPHGNVVRVPYTEHIPPDVVACIFWLKNRRPDLWRDKVDHQHSGKDGGPIQLENMTQEEIDRELVKLLSKVDVRRLLPKDGQPH